MTMIDRRAALTASASIAVAAALPRFASAQQTTVKLGVICPMTGLFAYNGAKLALVIGDSQSEPDAAVAEVDRLSDARVSVFLYSSGITLVASQAASRRSIPFMSDVATSDEVRSDKPRAPWTGRLRETC